MRNLLARLLLVIATIGLSYSLLFGWMVARSPISYAEMDFDHDGKVSLSEVDYASSFGARLSTVGGQQCVEYFALKDGLPLKTKCKRD